MELDLDDEDEEDDTDAPTEADLGRRTQECPRHDSAEDFGQ